MHSATLLLLAAVVTVTYAVGQYYVPRSYYVIDAEGHESSPVPLRRLRRSLDPYPYLGRREAVAPGINAHGGGPHALAKRAHGRRLSAQGGWRTLSAANPNVRKS